MDKLFDILYALFIGIVEGITEWLPISSTGHMILVNSIFESRAFFNTDLFLYVIQLGAILAIVTLYFNKLNPFAPSKSPEEKKSTWQMWFKVVAACVPSAVIGLIIDNLFGESDDWRVVSATLIIYGIAFVILEIFNKKSPRITAIDQFTYKTALLIGAFQVLAVIPGTSRSGATILGAMLIGCSRAVAAEFSFFLAIPVMFGVSALRILTNEYVMSSWEWLLLAVSMVAAYAVSMIAVKFLTSFVKKHDFKPFGWYRIILGAAVIAYFAIVG